MTQYDDWNRRVFKAPSLPATTQIWAELPFTARFRAKDHKK